MTTGNIFAYTVFIIVILTFITIIPFVAFFRLALRLETYQRLRPIAILILIFMLILNLSHLSFLAGMEVVSELTELSAVVFLFITTIYMAKNLSIEYILLRTATELENRLKEKEEDLQDKTRELLYQSQKLWGLYKAVKKLNYMVSFDELIDSLLDTARKLVNARYAAFATYDDHKKIERFIFSGLNLSEVDKIGEWPKGLGLLSIQEEKQPLRVDNIVSNVRYCGFPPNHPKMETLLKLPILSTEKNLIGVLYLADKKSGPFTKDDESTMTTLITEAATSIERIRLFNQISKARDEWQMTLDSIGDLVAIHDKDHRIVRVNLAFRKKLGLPFDKIIGQDCKIMEGIFFSKTKGCPHNRVVELKTYIVDEIMNPSGEVFFISSYPSYDEEGNISTTIHVARDVSVFKKLARTEEERKRLEELNKFKSQFVSLIAHEFRTPLTSLQGFSELLVNRKMDKESLKRWGMIILEESQLLGRLVNDILDLSRVEAGHLKIKKESFSFEELLKKGIERFRLSFTKCTYKEEIPAALPPVYGDKNRIFQILTNLIDNATKYSPEGEEIVVSAVTEDSVVKVGVTDKGYGIPEELSDKIFEPFYRVDTPEIVNAAGTGLGLSISKAIIEMHGGRIWAESKVGKGSTFYFTIPLA